RQHSRRGPAAKAQVELRGGFVKQPVTSGEPHEGRRMRLSRRGLILGGSSALLAGCASTAPMTSTPAVLAQAASPAPVTPPAPAITVAEVIPPQPLDPWGRVRPELMSRAMAALDIHHHRLPLRDRMYLVDFDRFSGDERLFE